MHSVVALGMRHQWIEDGGFLRKSDDYPTGWARWRCLGESGLAQQMGGEEAGSPAYGQHSQCIAPRVVRCGCRIFGHNYSSLVAASAVALTSLPQPGGRRPAALQ